MSAVINPERFPDWKPGEKTAGSFGAVYVRVTGVDEVELADGGNVTAPSYPAAIPGAGRAMKMMIAMMSLYMTGTSRVVTMTNDSTGYLYVALPTVVRSIPHTGGMSFAKCLDDPYQYEPKAELARKKRMKVIRMEP